MDINTATEILELLLDVDIPVFLHGPSGVGKSTMPRTICTRRKWGMIDFRASLRDPVDMHGMPAADLENRKAVWLTPDDLPNVKRDGKYGILFLDELNVASTAMMNACLGLTLDRKIGDYVLPEGWRIVAAGNRQQDRAAVNKVPGPVNARFAHIEIEADLDTYVEYCYDNDIHEMIPGFLRFRPELLLKIGGANENASPNPRNWDRVAKVIDVPERLRMRTIATIVGEGAAGEVEAFIRTYMNLPDFEDIIDDPENTEVPDDPSGKYAVVGMLARRATKKNFSSIIKYGKRLGREFEIVMVLDACKRDADLTETKAFIEFQVRNKNLVLPLKMK